MTTIGQQLLQARKKRGLSLQDVAHKTRIPVPRLQDLEADNYNSHGGLIYAKGFLRTYAAHLQVDASPILDRLQPPPLAGKRDYTYLVKNLGPWLKARQFKALTPKRATASQGGSVLSMALIVGAIVLLGTSLMFANAMFNTGTNANQPAADIVAAEAPVQEKKAPVNSAALPPISSKRSRWIACAWAVTRSRVDWRKFRLRIWVTAAEMPSTTTSTAGKLIMPWTAVPSAMVTEENGEAINCGGNCTPKS